MKVCRTCIELSSVLAVSKGTFMACCHSEERDGCTLSLRCEENPYKGTADMATPEYEKKKTTVFRVSLKQVPVGFDELLSVRQSAFASDTDS